MKTIVLHLWLGLLVTLVMLQGGLAQSNSGNRKLRVAVKCPFVTEGTVYTM